MFTVCYIPRERLQHWQGLSPAPFWVVQSNQPIVSSYSTHQIGLDVHVRECGRHDRPVLLGQLFPLAVAVFINPPLNTWRGRGAGLAQLLRISGWPHVIYQEQLFNTALQQFIQFWAQGYVEVRLQMYYWTVFVCVTSCAAASHVWYIDICACTDTCNAYVNIIVSIVCSWRSKKNMER